MSLTLNTKTYKADSFEPNKVKYFGPAHTVSKKDDVQIARVLPKPTKDSKGVARQSQKLTRTATLPDGSLADAIIDISSSVPVGYPSDELALLKADASDLIQLEEAGTTNVIGGGIISY